MSAWFDDFAERARLQPNAPAIIHPRAQAVEQITYGELYERASRLAEDIARRRWPFVMTYMSKSIDSIAIMLAALARRIPFSCLNRRLKSRQIEELLQVTGATSCIVDQTAFDTLRDSFAAGWGGTREWYAVRCANTEKTKSLERIDVDSSASMPARVSTVQSLDSVGVCLFTSGSTGVPKGVLIPGTDLKNRAWAEVELYRLTSKDVLLSALPVSFDVGLNQILSGLLAGAAIVVSDSWLPVDIMRSVARHAVSGISGVPALWKDMLSMGAKFQIGGEHRFLRYITISGGDLPERELLQIPGMAPGVEIYKTYGQTETFRSTALLPEEFQARPTSVGRGFATAQFFVVREDGGLCAPGETGEIVHAGLGTMQGYLDGGDAEKLRDPPKAIPWGAGRVIYTGDMGYVDEQGYLFLRGRSDGMLKIASNRVYPSEIVSVILEHPEVIDAFVIGQVAPGGNRFPFAFVVPRKASSLSENEMKQFLRNRLPNYMIPRWFRLIDSIPRTASGKPDGPTLKDWASDQIFSELKQPRKR